MRKFCIVLESGIGSPGFHYDSSSCTQGASKSNVGTDSKKGPKQFTDLQTFREN
jgi:hypothetical protein